MTAVAISTSSIPYCAVLEQEHCTYVLHYSKMLLIQLRILVDIVPSNSFTVDSNTGAAVEINSLAVTASKVTVHIAASRS